VAPKKVEVPSVQPEALMPDELARGSFMTKEPPDIIGSGYVVKSLEAALWAFHHSSDFKEGCLMAVIREELSVLLQKSQLFLLAQG
jgi:hypothetical protein